ncbi:MAG: hypothetical protein SXV54_20565 [Chloroflexota bacterium]|nr:hypothetical protein [Chloroflexota bacterium]
MSTKTGITALVTVLGGNPVEVVISTDPEALERRGKAFVEEQGSNAHYELHEVEILPSEPAADPVSIQGLLSAPQDLPVVLLWCKRCDWRGLSSEAGWSDGSQGFGWSCPECGGAEYIRVVAPETADPAQV